MQSVALQDALVATVRLSSPRGVPQDTAGHTGSWQLRSGCLVWSWGQAATTVKVWSSTRPVWVKVIVTV